MSLDKKLGIKIFNKAIFNAFMGFADQGQVFKRDSFYTLRNKWKYSDGSTGKFLVTGKMIYQAFRGNLYNDRFKNIDITSKQFLNQMILNLCI
tara:strand:+ start:218 stop:496 length:279 start_codon:yes stop_codon:yes gene_type:complete